MTERALLVAIDRDIVGTLRESQNIWTFEYDAAWLANPAGFALSPSIPLIPGPQTDGASTRPVQWYFDNLLPEEAVRRLLAYDAGLRDVNDAFGLLAYYGGESAGSVTLCEPDRLIPAEDTLRPLSDIELEARIRDLPTVPLTHDAPKKMSLAGAQHKLAVVLRDGQLFEPSGHAVSTHILKPNHPQNDDYPHSVINEWFVMRLAQRIGLEVPTVTRRYVPTPVYVIERFDRDLHAHGASRRHAIDGCQLLNLAAMMKYSAWTLDALADLVAHCRSPAQTRIRTFRWLVFCIVVGNGDSHLKNLSYLINRSGITLAPHYDLLCEAVYDTRAFSTRERWPALSTFTRHVGKTERYIDFTKDILADAGVALGLGRPLAVQLIETMVRTVPTAATALIDEVAAENAAILETRPELAATFAGEMRLLRAINLIVIAEMAQRLQ